MWVPNFFLYSAHEVHKQDCEHVVNKKYTTLTWFQETKYAFLHMDI